MGLLDLVLAIGILAALILSIGGADATGRPPCDFPAIYNFGDSNSDTGGISAAFVPIGEPYGVGYFKKPAGRDSDGRLIIDFIGIKMGLLDLVLAIGILAALILSIGGADATGRPPCDFPAIYNFGDSNSDTGGISAAFVPIGEPYGVGYFKKPAGRDSDGRLIIDFIAEHLGLPYLSAYLNSIAPNFRHGANFATGGSTIRRQNETIFEYGISPFSLDMQIIQFDQFKTRTTELYNQADTEKEKLSRPEEFSKALYTFDIGQNDLSVGFRKLSNDQLRAAIPDIVNQLASAVQNVYRRGGRTFWIHNTGPIGCLPVATFYIKNPEPGYLDDFGCIKYQNEMAMEFNKRLKDRVNLLRTEVPHAAITYVDIYAAKYGMISNTKTQGFTNAVKVCCGHHVDYTHIWCGQKGLVSNGSEVYGASCATPSTYISWDGVHYSEAANHLVANQFLNGSLTDPPIPVTHACYQL